MPDKKYWYKQYLTSRILHKIYGDENFNESEAKLMEARVSNIFDKITTNGFWDKSFRELLNRIIKEIYEEEKNKTKEKEFFLLPTTVRYLSSHH